MANTWPPAGEHFADIGDAVLDAAVARRDQAVVGYFDRIEFDVMGRRVERVLGFRDPKLRRIQRRIGAIQLLPPLIEQFLGLDALLHRVNGAIHFLLGQKHLRLLLRDIGIGFVDGLFGLVDGGLRSLQRGLEVARIHAGDHLPGFHQIALVGHDFGNAGGVFGVDVDFVGFEPAIAENDTGRQCGVELLPPIVAAAGAADQHDKQKRRLDPAVARAPFGDNDREACVQPRRQSFGGGPEPALAVVASRPATPRA